MKIKRYLSLAIATIFIVGCGGGGSVEADENELAIDSLQHIETALQSSGYRLEKLVVESSSINKLSTDKVKVSYGAEAYLLLSTATFYRITDEADQIILATLDGNSTADDTESQTHLVIEHYFDFIPVGYTNLNTTTTNPKATKLTILAEVQKAFTQFTLNNPTTPSTATLSNDINIGYETALKNHEEGLSCNHETYLIDAEKNYTLLSNLQEGNVTCYHGTIPLMSFEVTSENTAPIANNDTASTAHNTPVTISVLSNDTDADGHKLSVTDANVLEGEGTVNINKDGTIIFTPANGVSGIVKITYTINDGNGGIDTAEATVTVAEAPVVTPENNTTENIDTIAPVLTLNGDSNITIYVGEDYTELGATANDETDGPVNVEITGSVDTATVGTYTITYTAKDKAENEAKATRTVRVALPDSLTDFSGLSTFDGPFGSKGINGTITDANGIASVRIDFSDESYSEYPDGNIDRESTHSAGTTYTITVIDGNGVVRTLTGTL
jgi:hypothetical protein